MVGQSPKLCDSHSQEATALGSGEGKGGFTGLCQHATFFEDKKYPNNAQVFMLKATQVHSKSCHGRFYQKTVVTDSPSPLWGPWTGDNVPQATNPSLAATQLLGSSIYLLSKPRHCSPFSGPVEVWKLCFTRLMVGKLNLVIPPQQEVDSPAMKPTAVSTQDLPDRFKHTSPWLFLILLAMYRHA